MYCTFGKGFNQNNNMNITSPETSFCLNNNDIN